jgi:hypothetical protein
MRDTMNEALSRASDGGACVGKVFVSNPFDVFSRSAVLEAALGKVSSEGPDPLDITLRFALAVDQCDDVGAMVPVECHGAEIPSMSETEKILGSIPPTTAVDAGAGVLPVVQTSENTRSLLLQMINVLKDLVSSIKEAPDADSPPIHSFAFKLAYSVLSSTNRIL